MSARGRNVRVDVATDTEMEIAGVLRTLAARPWLVSGRDDEVIAAARRNTQVLRTALSRLGWSLHVSRDLVRLRKSPPPRIDDWTVQAPSPLACTWVFLFAAAAEGLRRSILIGELIDAGKVVAAEAGVPVVEGHLLRRAHTDALKQLCQRGIVAEVDGRIEDYMVDPDQDVLLRIEHSRLPHLVMNFTSEIDPVSEPEAWVDALMHEPDAGRRMRRRLVDDTVIHTTDLDDQEMDWLSRRLRGDDGRPLAASFGLTIERRTEGAAFVVPDEAYRRSDELGEVPFPTRAIEQRVALVLCDFVATTDTLDGNRPGSPGPGWRGMERERVLEELTQIANEQRTGRGGWSEDYTTQPSRLLAKAEAHLVANALLRVADGWWWVSPALGRWEAPPNRPFTTVETGDSTARALSDSAGDSVVEPSATVVAEPDPGDAQLSLFEEEA
ncbi:DUF2398 family protein [Promicromonospora sp. NPDC090134]|uniref:DUF2398 family protein n=1 Tax=Promicromonospora sp. NPDC090134 TaxID=3364408 RepID=UPI003829438C